MHQTMSHRWKKPTSVKKSLLKSILDFEQFLIGGKGGKKSVWNSHQSNIQEKSYAKVWSVQEKKTASNHVFHVWINKAIGSD